MNMKSLKSSLLVAFFGVGLLMQMGCKKADKGKDDLVEKAGMIPGMGDAGGTLGGTMFQLPAGIKLVGSISGQEDGPSASDCVYDGQGMFVTVKMTLQREDSTGGPTVVEFPAGLVITTASEGFQHGLLVEREIVTIPPAVPGPGGGPSKCNVTLMLSCLNASKKPSDATAKYTFGPVTNAALIKNFISLLANKKIRYSQFPPQDTDWSINQERLQEALWHITDGNGLTTRDLEHISNLPDK